MTPYNNALVSVTFGNIAMAYR